MHHSVLWHNLEESYWNIEEIPQPKHDELLIEACYSLISIGTERLVLTQSLQKTTATRMRVPYMRGEFNSSFTYGYSLTGIVRKGPPEYIGKAVHIMHPHQSWAVVKTSAAYLLPNDLDIKSATLISNMETAVNAIWDSQISLGDSVIVFGYGIIGTLVCAIISQFPGINLHVVEPDASRAGAARLAGLDTLSTTANLGHNVDIAINTAANSASLQNAIEAVGFEGTVIELGWYGARSTSLMLGDSFHYDRKRIQSSQVSNIPSHKQSRWTRATRKNLVSQLLADIDSRLIITRSIEYQCADQFYNQLRKTNPVDRGIVINYRET